MVCASGLLNCWVPFGEYTIQARADEACPLPDELKAVRDRIINGCFDIGACKKISIQKAHQAVVGASSPCVKKACRCSFGKCTGTCGCKRTNRQCHSGCSCNRNCKWSHDST